MESDGGQWKWEFLKDIGNHRARITSSALRFFRPMVADDNCFQACPQLRPVAFSRRGGVVYEFLPGYCYDRSALVLLF
jgi:hypothetical protein